MKLLGTHEDLERVELRYLHESGFGDERAVVQYRRHRYEIEDPIKLLLLEIRGEGHNHRLAGESGEETDDKLRAVIRDETKAHAGTQTLLEQRVTNYLNLG